MIPQEIKERIKKLGKDFSNKKSRDELFLLITKYIHQKTDTMESKYIS